MHSTAVVITIIAMVIGLRGDIRLFIAGLIMFVSMLIGASWEEGFGGFLRNAVIIDSIFAILFIMLSNMIYGTVMVFLLGCNSLLGFFSYSQYLNGGGYFYSEYEYINGMITLLQAISLLIVGGMQKQEMYGELLGRFYHIRLSFSSVIRFFICSVLKIQKV